MDEINPGQQQRILRAIDTNAVLCETCGVRFRDLHHARLENKSASDGPTRLALCKQSGPDCQGARTFEEIKQGKRAGKRAYELSLREQLALGLEPALARTMPEYWSRVERVLPDVERFIAENREGINRLLGIFDDALADVWAKAGGDLAQVPPPGALAFALMVRAVMVKRRMREDNMKQHKPGQITQTFEAMAILAEDYEVDPPDEEMAEVD